MPLAAWILLASYARPAAAQEVVAVLASEQRAQRETFESFLAVFGKPVPVVPMGEEIPAAAKVVVAFGGKAAIQRYPGRVTLIYAIAPGLVVGPETHDGRSIKVMMEPESAALLTALLALQPRLKRLTVLWSSANRAPAVARLAKMGAARGIAVDADRLEHARDLPDRLRRLEGKVDAIWLPPDPLLINENNFETIKQFSYDNNIPFYAPTEGLAEHGAIAALSISSKEMGRQAAVAAKSVLDGGEVAAELYSEKIRVTVNRAAAEQAELTVPAEALNSADKVLR